MGGRLDHLGILLLQVAVPAIVRQLEIPCTTEDCVVEKEIKSSLLLLMQQLAPESMRKALSLENFM